MRQSVVVEHVGIYLNRSRERPGEVTIDLVNYQYDLTADRLTPVVTADFRITVGATQFASVADVQAEAICYGETAHNHITRSQLAELSVTTFWTFLREFSPPRPYGLRLSHIPVQSNGNFVLSGSGFAVPVAVFASRCRSRAQV
jgi:hypothetical protein